MSEVWKVLSADATILALMDLTSATAVDKAKRIVKASSAKVLATGGKCLCIYVRPSRRGRTDFHAEDVMQIDCHVPDGQDYVAYRIQERVYRLLHDRSINRKPFAFDGMLGELPTATGFFCAGSRFTFPSTKT